jgi:IS605 OrfB family transposase
LTSVKNVYIHKKGNKIYAKICICIGDSFSGYAIKDTDVISKTNGIISNILKEGYTEDSLHELTCRIVKCLVNQNVDVLLLQDYDHLKELVDSKFRNFPFSNFINLLAYKSRRKGIRVIREDESVKIADIDHFEVDLNISQKFVHVSPSAKELAENRKRIVLERFDTNFEKRHVDLTNYILQKVLPRIGSTIRQCLNNMKDCYILKHPEGIRDFKNLEKKLGREATPYDSVTLLSKMILDSERQEVEKNSKFYILHKFRSVENLFKNYIKHLDKKIKKYNKSDISSLLFDFVYPVIRKTKNDHLIREDLNMVLENLFFFSSGLPAIRKNLSNKYGSLFPSASSDLVLVS